MGDGTWPVTGHRGPARRLTPGRHGWATVALDRSAGPTPCPSGPTSPPADCLPEPGRIGAASASRGKRETREHPHSTHRRPRHQLGADRQRDLPRPGSARSGCRSSTGTDTSPGRAAATAGGGGLLRRLGRERLFGGHRRPSSAGGASRTHPTPMIAQSTSIPDGVTMEAAPSGIPPGGRTTAPATPRVAPASACHERAAQPPRSPARGFMPGARSTCRSYTVSACSARRLATRKNAAASARHPESQQAGRLVPVTLRRGTRVRPCVPHVDVPNARSTRSRSARNRGTAASPPLAAPALDGVWRPGRPGFG